MDRVRKPDRPRAHLWDVASRSIVLAFVLGGQATSIAQDCKWESLAGGGFTGVSPHVQTLDEFNHGAGTAMYAGGVFSESLGSPGNRIASWNGEAWLPLGRGLSGSAYDLVVHNDGSGPALYATGPFTRAGEVLDANAIARWDGQEWSALGVGLSNEEPPHYRNGAALAVFDDGSGSGPELYVGGSFTHAGDEPALNIARWDGSAWSAVGAGVPGAPPGIRALAVFDDGSGPALYAGGFIFAAVVRWDGVSWEHVGVGGPGNVEAMAVFDDGAGPALYVGSQNYNGLRKWDGETWTVVGGGTDFTVRSLHVFDDGSGPALFVGGAFHHAGGKQVYGIAKWDGSEWHDLGGGVYHERGMSVDAMTTFDDGSGPALYVAGKFDFAGWPAGIPVENIARWRCSGGCYADCDGSGDLTFFDFLCFQNLFAAMDPEADCDGDTAFTFFDFLCFQNAFATGCP